MTYTSPTLRSAMRPSVRLTTEPSGYSITDRDSTRQRALEQCRGTYQRAIVLGEHSITTSTLTGRAGSYGGRYRQSVLALLERLTDAGVEWTVCLSPRRRHILALGELPSTVTPID